MTSKISTDPFYRKIATRATVRELMTPRVMFLDCQPDEPAHAVFERMKERDIDQAPVNREGEISEYVLRVDLPQTKVPVDTFAKPVRPSNLMSSNSRITSALPLIHRAQFFFVLPQDEIAGIITHADFDKRPVRVLLYLLFSELESSLQRLMRMYEATPAYWFDKLPPNAKKEVARWHKKREAKGVKLDALDCFSLIHLFTALRSEERFHQLIGDRLHDYEKLYDLRNRVSHSGLDIAASPQEIDDLIGAKSRLIMILDRVRRVLTRG